MEDNTMRKKYESPQIETVSIYTMQLMEGSGVYGDGAASDITYGGVDDGENEPEAKSYQSFSLWDE